VILDAERTNTLATASHDEIVEQCLVQLRSVVGDTEPVWSHVQNYIHATTPNLPHLR